MQVVDLDVPVPQLAGKQLQPLPQRFVGRACMPERGARQSRVEAEQLSVLLSAVAAPMIAALLLLQLLSSAPDHHAMEASANHAAAH